MILKDLLRVLGSADRRDGRNLTKQEAFQAFASILEGGESEIRVATFLTAMRWKGVSVEELTGFATAARQLADLPCVGMAGLVCVCPPMDGYDEVPPLELASALVTAAAGVRVLMMTDRGVPPRRGLTAASALEALGAGIFWDPHKAEDCVAEIGFAALSLTSILPPLLGLRRVRGDMGLRTPLSTVEKLILPPTASVVIGTQAGPVLGIAVETMSNLGHPSGIALQGLRGGTTPTVRKRTRGIELSGQHKTPLTVDPADFGLMNPADPELPMFGPPEDGRGSGDNPALRKAAAEMVRDVLDGHLGPARDATLLGAAVLLKAAGRVMTLAEGVDTAVTSLDSQAPLDILDKFVGWS